MTPEEAKQLIDKYLEEDRVVIMDTGFLNELKEWSDDRSKKLFRNKVQMIYFKCLRRNRIKTAVRIADKYKKELAETLRSDLSIAMRHALFTNSITNT